MNYSKIVIRQLEGLRPYIPIWQAMQAYTESRCAHTADEIWLLEHAPVFTQGRIGKAEHILSKGAIEIVQTDRGGQVTYHGPGQLIVYFLVDIRRCSIGVRTFVTFIENMVVDILKQYDVAAHVRRNAPGVYVHEYKIASLGLRVRRGCTFHGLALNVNMDLSPFLCINPCGYRGLKMVQLKDFNQQATLESVMASVASYLRNSRWECHDNIGGVQ